MDIVTEHGASLDQTGELHDRCAVAGDELVEVRPLDLDDDLLTAVEAGAVHLCDRGARQRFPVEAVEHLVRRST